VTDTQRGHALRGSDAAGQLGAGSLRLGIPFVGVHAGVLLIPFVGWSPVSIGVAVLLYLWRAFGITVIYHRGLAHRAFKMTRTVQIFGALVAASAAQRGPLWWVAHHRTHHRATDRAGDPHSPDEDGLLWSHLLWMFSDTNQPTNMALVPDLARFRELRLLDRFHHLAPAALAAATVVGGVVIGRVYPGTGVNGPQLFVWGFCVSTVLLWHSTFAVNSLCHRFGRRPFETRDASRNLWWLALLTMGEGWHNNHHRFPSSARQGLGRFEVDPSWWLIKALVELHLARDLRLPPARLPGAWPPSEHDGAGAASRR
jgi:stearoyl-CoA desaturase (delta-9 desaturase)